MAHPRFGTTKRKDTLLEKLQTALESNTPFTKSEVTLLLEGSVDNLVLSTDRLNLLKRAVGVQLNFLRFCNKNGINISRGLEKWLEEKTKDNEN